MIRAIFRFIFSSKTVTRHALRNLQDMDATERAHYDDIRDALARCNKQSEEINALLRSRITINN